MTKKNPEKTAINLSNQATEGEFFSLEKVPWKAMCAQKESRIHYLEGMILDTFSFFHSTANIYIPPSLWILQRFTWGTHRPSFSCS